MKNVVIELTIVLTLILISGLGGCANNRHQEEETAQPVTTQPANTQAKMEQEISEEEIGVEPKERHPLTRQMDRQVHNAELADMCLTDIHFLPNRPALNSNGTQRLSHLAWLVEQYGGSIKLDLEEPDTLVAKERIQTVVNYLRSWGLPEPKIQVCLGLPDSKGMEAKEAILIYNDTRYQPKDKETGSGRSLPTNAR